MTMAERRRQQRPRARQAGDVGDRLDRLTLGILEHQHGTKPPSVIAT
jgi:hypothetical protein